MRYEEQELFDNLKSSLQYLQSGNGFQIKYDDTAFVYEYTGQLDLIIHKANEIKKRLTEKKEISRNVEISFLEDNDFSVDNVNWDEVNYDIASLCEELEEDRTRGGR